jgi:hypothetical protein
MPGSLAELAQRQAIQQRILEFPDLRNGYITATIRERYIQSRHNLIKLLPKLTELWVYENSEDSDPGTGRSPQVKLILHCVGGKVSGTCELSQVPEWPNQYSQ